MNPDLMVVLALLAAVVLMLALNRPRPDAVALLAMVVLPFTGVVTTPETLAGFANPNIVLIAAMFVIGDALARTGVAQRLGDWLIERGGTSELRLLVLLMTIVGVMGSMMSSTGVVAIFIPVVLRIASRSGAAPGRLMLPMAYAALISGTLTLVATSPNLVIDYELIGSGVPGFDFFSFTPFGLPILVFGIAYMALAASAAFMTPISPVNALVVTPGNDGFSDFVRFGLPLTLLTLGVAVLLVPWRLPLY